MEGLVNSIPIKIIGAATKSQVRSACEIRMREIEWREKLLTRRIWWAPHQAHTIQRALDLNDDVRCSAMLVYKSHDDQIDARSTR